MERAEQYATSWTPKGRRKVKEGEEGTDNERKGKKGQGEYVDGNVYVCVFVHVHVNVNVYSDVYVYENVFVYVYVHMYSCIHVYMYICIYV